MLLLLLLLSIILLLLLVYVLLDKCPDQSQHPFFTSSQEVTAMVQNALGAVASLGESVKNTFNFSVPFLSWLAIWALGAAAVLLYFVSPRYLIMAWGLNKFTKKLIRPNFVNNNEVMDFLSRVRT